MRVRGQEGRAYSPLARISTCKTLGWPKSLFSFFHNVKDTFFIFTNNFIDLDIRSMLAISRITFIGIKWYNIYFSQLMSRFDRYQLQLVYLTMEHCPARNLQHETLQTTFDMFSQSQHLLHRLHKSFLHFGCVFTFLEIIKHNMPKMLHVFFHLQY